MIECLTSVRVRPWCWVPLFEFSESFFARGEDFKKFKIMIVKVHTKDGQKKDKWVLIELQGQIKVRQQQKVSHITSEKNNKSHSMRVQSEKTTIGKLSIADGGNPVFVIGHHRLEGKFEKLKRPLALLKKSLKGETDGVEFDVLKVVKEKIVFKNRPRPLVSSAGSNSVTTKKRRIL